MKRVAKRAIAAATLRPTRITRAAYASRAWRDDAPRPSEPLPSGVLIAHKPQEWTSFDLCAAIRGTLEKQMRGHGHRFTHRRRLKVGHGGTLDPLAEGVMVVGVGDACKRMGVYLQGAKGYVARARLGSEMDTQDSTGEETVARPFDHVRLVDLQAAADGLTGEIMQRPPVFSAVKRGGKRAHAMARRGEVREEDMEERPVVVHRLQVLSFDGATGEFELSVSCGGGTYVRTLIVCIGRAVGSAAHMAGLLRTRVGQFCIASDADAATGHVLKARAITTRERCFSLAVCAALLERPLLLPHSPSPPSPSATLRPCARRWKTRAPS
jgi:tRNA pseudouridine55 synthase